METGRGAALGRKSGEMLVVPASGWENKGMITPEFTLHIAIWLPETPKALYNLRSCSVTLLRRTLGTGPSFPSGNIGCCVNVVWTHPPCVCICRLWHCATVLSLSTEGERPGHRQCFWSHNGAWCVFHVCLQMKIGRHRTAPVPVGSLVPACLSAGAGGRQVFVTVNMRH